MLPDQMIYERCCFVCSSAVCLFVCLCVCGQMLALIATFCFKQGTVLYLHLYPYSSVSFCVLGSNHRPSARRCRTKLKLFHRQKTSVLLWHTTVLHRRKRLNEPVNWLFFILFMNGKKVAWAYNKRVNIEFILQCMHSSFSRNDIALLKSLLRARAVSQ